MMNGTVKLMELLPTDVTSYFQTFREAFDADALTLLTTETFLLVIVSLLGVTLGLMKTTGADGADILGANSTTKGTSMGVLFITLCLTVHRNSYLNGPFYLLNDMIVLDVGVGGSQVGILVLALIFVAMSSPHNYTRNSYYYELMLFALTATMLMIGLVMTGNFIVFYLVLEGISLIFYTIATRTFVYGSVESGLKYYSLGALASVMLLVGILCTFAATGSTDFAVVVLMLTTLNSSNTYLLFILGLTLIVLAVFFKLSAFPGHVGTPDVYQGTSLEVLGIFAVLAKFTFLVFFLRFFATFYFTPTMFAATNFGVATSCIGSLLIGAAGAFLATNIKRFAAYTAINQMGFVFIGLSALSLDGIKSTLSYLYIYMLANVLFFCVITLLQTKKYMAGDISLRSLKDVALLKKAPIEMGLLAVALLSLAGLPPLAGFVGKYSLGASLMSQYLQTSSLGVAENLLYILIISVVLSLLSTFYYLRLIKMALFDGFEDSATISNIELRGSVAVSLTMSIVAILGFVTVGWFFLVYDLEVIGTRLLLSVTAPFGITF